MLLVVVGPTSKCIELNEKSKLGLMLMKHVMPVVLIIYF